MTTPSDEPIDFTARRNVQRAAHSEAGQMTCECQVKAEQPMGYIPILMRDAQGEFIAGLACAACGGGYNVIGGRIVYD